MGTETRYLLWFLLLIAGCVLAGCLLEPSTDDDEDTYIPE